MAELTLRNGFVVTPTGIVRGGLASEGGQIVAIGASAALPRGEMDIDVGGKVIFPGALDPHAHLGVGEDSGPVGFNREIVTESRDAAVGGVTCFVTTALMGTDSRLKQVDAEIEASRGEFRPYVDFRLTSVTTTEQHIEEIPDLRDRGVVSHKFFSGYSGVQARGFGMAEEGITPGFFYRACEAMKRAGPGVFPMVHAEEPTIRYMLQGRMRPTRRDDPLTAWHESSPDFLEPLQIHQHALITRELGVSLYVVHVSAAESVDLIRDLRAGGHDLTAETIVAFLYYTDREVDAKGLGALAKIQPPIRSPKDRARLWQGLREGSISTIGTDCEAYTRRLKASGDFWDVLVGIGPGMSVTLPILYSEGVNGGRIGLERLARALCENTARRYGLYPAKGVLQVGSDADVVVIDPHKELTIHQGMVQSGGDYSIYEGVRVRGAPTMTFVRGRLVARDYAIVADEPRGRYVLPEHVGVRANRQEVQR
jgi:dihydroorotase-like cyclic amidohydrolase